MANPYDQNYFGDSYYSFENNRNNGFQNTDRFRPQMRPQFAPKRNPNYGQQNDSYGDKSVGPVFNNTNDYYRRTNQPYFGQNRGPAGHQYRAQVIDYSSGPQSQSNYDSSPRMPSNRFPNNSQQFRPFSPNPTANNSPQQPMTGPQTGLLPTPPQHPYPNIRAYGQPSQPQHSSFNTGLLPMPSNQSYPQRFGSHPRPQQQNSYPATNQSYSHNYPQSVPQPVPQPVPKPVPQPVPPPPQHLQQAPPLPVPAPVSNAIRPQMVKIKVEADLQKQQKEEESRIASILSDGMENRVQNDLKGFYCLFCEIFCQNLLTAERHVDSPKHQRTKIGDNLKGIDAKFTIKSERISETAVALARKGELNKISNVIKNDYFNEGIRLKDGIGSEAYICENCGLSLDSLTSVTKHLETHKQFTEQLKICSKPVIGLDFVVEYIDPKPNIPPVYECLMCHSFHSKREIINHLCSYGHRTNFIRKIHPSEGQKYTSETQHLSLEAGKRALELETLIGRGQFKVKHMSAPPNCQSLLNISNAYNNSSNNFSNNSSNFCNTTDRTPTPKVVKPLFPIEIPVVKSEQEKTELEKVFSVKLDSESDANEVTQVISHLTQSVAEYHMKGMTPEKRQQFKKQHQID